MFDFRIWLKLEGPEKDQSAKKVLISRTNHEKKDFFGNILKIRLGKNCSYTNFALGMHPNAQWVPFFGRNTAIICEEICITVSLPKKHFSYNFCNASLVKVNL